MATNLRATEAVTCSQCGAHVATSTMRPLDALIRETLCVQCSRPAYGPASW